MEQTSSARGLLVVSFAGGFRRDVAGATMATRRHRRDRLVVVALVVVGGRGVRRRAASSRSAAAGRSRFWGAMGPLLTRIFAPRLRWRMRPRAAPLLARRRWRRRSRSADCSARFRWRFRSRRAVPPARPVASRRLPAARHVGIFNRFYSLAQKATLRCNLPSS